ncbi:hypothetical protein, partial [Actinotalea sp.]|uniref:hypothetical protein n=1 Tax=Actinotalea sp. TaxID=1872145 RepID=UPI003569562C
MSEERDGLRIHGGRGGTVATLEDLDRLAALLRGVADRLDEGQGAIRRLDSALDETWRHAPASAGAVDQALAPCRAVGRAAGRARELGSAVLAAREGYAAAEHGAAGLLRGAAVISGSVIGEGGPLVWAGAAAAAASLGVLATHAVLVTRFLRRSPTPLGAGLRSLAGLQGRSGPAGVVGEVMAGPGPLPAVPARIDGWESVVPPLAAFLRGALPGRRPPTLSPV